MNFKWDFPEQNIIFYIMLYRINISIIITYNISVGDMIYQSAVKDHPWHLWNRPREDALNRQHQMYQPLWDDDGSDWKVGWAEICKAQIHDGSLVFSCPEDWGGNFSHDIFCIFVQRNIEWKRSKWLVNLPLIQDLLNLQYWPRVSLNKALLDHCFWGGYNIWSNNIWPYQSSEF